MSKRSIHFSIQASVDKEKKALIFCKPMNSEILCSELLYLASDNFNMRSSTTKFHIVGERTPPLIMQTRLKDHFMRKKKLQLPAIKNLKKIFLFVKINKK